VSIYWSQDDFEQIIKQFFIAFEQFSKLEVITGADRATVRFSWLEHYFYLQFECYIDAIWIEACDQVSECKLTDLSAYIQNNK